MTNDAYIWDAHRGDVELEALLVALADEAHADGNVRKMHLCADYVRLERVKMTLDRDITDRGIGREETNGKQKYWKENKSVELFLKYGAKQDKILKALGLDSAPSKSEPDDGFDDI